MHQPVSVGGSVNLPRGTVRFHPGLNIAKVGETRPGCELSWPIRWLVLVLLLLARFSRPAANIELDPSGCPGEALPWNGVNGESEGDDEGGLLRERITTLGKQENYLYTDTIAPDYKEVLGGK